jgi:hypothetical protein
MAAKGWIIPKPEPEMPKKKYISPKKKVYGAKISPRVKFKLIDSSE